MQAQQFLQLDCVNRINPSDSGYTGAFKFISVIKSPEFEPNKQQLASPKFLPESAVPGNFPMTGTAQACSIGAMITASTEFAKYRSKSVLKRHRKMLALFCVTAGMSGVAIAVWLALALQSKPVPSIAYFLFGILWTLFAGGIVFSARREMTRSAFRRVALAKHTVSYAAA
jgi:hypothetical protein